MTYRERKERKAERLRDWSDKRERDAAQVFRSHEHYRGDTAFNTQPGHIPERARVIAREERAHESLGRAQDMSDRAEGIERQLATSIYDDDPDAIERLEAKVALLEAARVRIKAYNASCRKAAKTGGQGDESLLSARQREGLHKLRKFVPYQVGRGGALPTYELSSLSQRIREASQRIERLKREREQGPRDRIMASKLHTSECAECGAELHRGDMIRYNRQQGARCHPSCKEAHDG